MPPCRRRSRLSRAVAVAVLAVLVVPVSAAATEMEGFNNQAVVSAERYHDLGGHEYKMRFVPHVPSSELLRITRVTLPIERRPGTSPGPVTVRLGDWTDNPNNEDVDYWLAQRKGDATVPEAAIPVSAGPGYSGGTVEVPIPNGGGLFTGNVFTVVVTAGGNPGDLVLGAADRVNDNWNVANHRPVGGEWAAMPDVFGFRFYVQPWTDPVPEPEPEPVPAWPFAGFYSPVNAEPTVNVVNAGSAVPFKFSLGADRGLGILVGTPSAQRVSCDPSDPSDVLEETAAASQSGLSYDPFADRYQYAWKTAKEQAGTCQRFVLRLGDGTTHTALFRLR